MEEGRKESPHEDVQMELSDMGDPTSASQRGSLELAAKCLIDLLWIRFPPSQLHGLSRRKIPSASPCLPEIAKPAVGGLLMTSSTMVSMRAGSLIWASPWLAMTESGSPPPCHIASKTCFAVFPDSVPSTMRTRIPARCSGGTGLREISRLALRSAAESSPVTQLAASFGCPDVLVTAS